MKNKKSLLMSIFVFCVIFTSMAVFAQSGDFYIEEQDDRSTFDNNNYQNDSAVNTPSTREEAYLKRESGNSNQVSSTRAVGQTKYDLTGLASWYGREFHGRLTASGEKFDMYSYTAAHKTLPFNTVLSVTNLANGKTVKVRITDRGPYKEPRILDLSYAAARDVDMLSAGEVRVGIKILEMGDGKRINNNTSGASPAGVRYSEHDTDDYSDDNSNTYSNTVKRTGNLRIQVGAFYSVRNAEKLKYKLESMFGKEVVIENENDMYKVRIINVADIYEAEEIKRQLNQQNMPGMILK